VIDAWIVTYNSDRIHQGKMRCGRAPMQTLMEVKEVWHDKIATLNR